MTHQQLAASNQQVSLLQQHLSVSNSQLEVAREELNDAKQHLLEMNQQLSQNYQDPHIDVYKHEFQETALFSWTSEGYISSGQYEVVL